MIQFAQPIDWIYHGGTESVVFTILNDGSPVQCRVSRECIQDNMGNPGAGEECLDAARKHVDKIENIIGVLVAAHRFEDDGSIVVRSSDWSLAS